MRLLNASGCLDALTAPDVARELDAFVTKTVTPLPREGNPPVRIAETDVGMLNSIGLANPGIDRFLADHLPRLARARRAALGFGRRLLGARLRRALRAPRRPRRGRRDRAEPLLPERGRGAGERRPRVVAAVRAVDGQAALREALAGRVGRAPRPRAPRRPRAPTASASSTRSAASRSTSARSGRCSRAAPAASPVPPCARSPSPPSMRAAGRPTCPSSAWAEWRPEGTRWSSSQPAQTTSRSGRRLFADPGAARPAFAPNWPPSWQPSASPILTTRWASLTSRKSQPSTASREWSRKNTCISTANYGG